MKLAFADPLYPGSGAVTRAWSTWRFWRTARWPTVGPEKSVEGPLTPDGNNP